MELENQLKPQVVGRKGGLYLLSQNQSEIGDLQIKQDISVGLYKTIIQPTVLPVGLLPASRAEINIPGNPSLPIKD